MLAGRLCSFFGYVSLTKAVMSSASQSAVLSSRLTDLHQERRYAMHSSTANQSQVSPEPCSSSSMSMSDPRWVSVSDPRWVSVSEEKRNELLEKHRDVNVGYAWWDFLYEDFVTGLAEIGIDVDTKQRRGYAIYFSGFWSQGDGACFEGSVSDWAKLLTAMNEERFIGPATEIGWMFRCSTSGHYSHSGTMAFEGEIYAPENPFDKDQDLLQHEAWKIGKPTDEDIDGLYERLKTKFVELADQLYTDLEAEYDYLTDDEQVIDYILEYAAEELIEEEEDEETA